MSKPLVNRSASPSPGAMPPQVPRTGANQPSVRSELAAAVRKVNAAFARLPAEAQGQVDVAVDPVEAEVDAAILAGDRDRAIAAIRAWCGYWLDRIERAQP